MARTESSRGQIEIGRPSVAKWGIFPKEHGAYPQLIFPILTGLALGNVTTAQVLVVVAAVALFFAHEPVLVELGQRGERARIQSGARTLWTAAGLLLLAAFSGGFGLWSASAATRLAALLPLSLAAVLAGFIYRRREKTAAGELLAALTLASVLVPIAMAGGVSMGAALTASGIWAVVFLLATFTVRAVIASIKNKTSSVQPHHVVMAVSGAAIASAVFLIVANVLPALVGLALLPSTLIGLICGALRVHPRNLRTIGWSLAASNIIAFVSLLVGLR